MTRPRVPRDLLDPVVAYFKPQRVILFGSRARGEAIREIADLAATKDWSDWATVYRYPARGRAKPLPEEHEIQRALAIIDELAARLRAANPEPAGDEAG